MTLLSWSDKYSVGVKSLDDQHTAIMALLNELYAAILKGNANAQGGLMLNKLVAFAREHFQAEESLFEATQYPAAAWHSARHQELLQQVDEYMARYRQGDRTLYLELLRFMRDWLSKHLLEEDQKYSAWMRSHGIA